MRFMSKTRIRSWIALGCALGLGAFAFVLVSRSPESEDGVLQASKGTSEGDAKRGESMPSRKAFGPESADDEETRRSGPRPQNSEVQPEDDDWDELSSAERRARLEDDFSRAVEELEAGRGSPQIVAQAEGALSELRAQMYSTPSGRKEHEALEERLSTVTEERKDDDVDEER